jgi:hypothetical protein
MVKKKYSRFIFLHNIFGRVIFHVVEEVKHYPLSYDHISWIHCLSLNIRRWQVMKPTHLFEIVSCYLLITVEKSLERKILIPRNCHTSSLDTTYLFLVCVILIASIELRNLSPFVILLHFTLRHLTCLQDAGPFLAGCSQMLMQNTCSYPLHLFATQECSIFWWKGAHSWHFNLQILVAWFKLWWVDVGSLLDTV